MSLFVSRGLMYETEQKPKSRTLQNGPFCKIYNKRHYFLAVADVVIIIIIIICSIDPHFKVRNMDCTEIKYGNLEIQT